MERKPDQSYVLANLDLVDCLLRGGAQKGLWDHVDPKTLHRALLETCTNGVVLRIWLRGITAPEELPKPSELQARAVERIDEAQRETENRASKLTERTKEEAEEVVASLEKTLLGTGPGRDRSHPLDCSCLNCDVARSAADVERAAGVERCAECNVVAPAEGSLFTAGWKRFDGRLYCSPHSEVLIRAAQRELRETEEAILARETAESLHVLLVSLLPEGQVPPLWKVRYWHGGATPEDRDAFREVALWAQREHAWTNPIAGSEPPPKRPFPQALEYFRDNPFTELKKPGNGKKVTPRGPSESKPAKKKRAPRKKAIRTRRAAADDGPHPGQIDDDPDGDTP